MTGRMLIAVVFDSDVAGLTGWSGGALAFRWWFNGEPSHTHFAPSTNREPAEEGEPADPAPVVAAMRGWAPGVDADMLADILTRTYTFAESGLFQALAALGVVTDGLAYDVNELAAAELALVPPNPLPDLIGGDAATEPVEPRRMFVAAAIDHDSEGWSDFVLMNELELWGEPGCLVLASTDFVTSIHIVPARGFRDHCSWRLYLASEPPLFVRQHSLPLGMRMGLPIAGPLHLVPSEHDNPAAAVSWARAHVAADRRPTLPVRERTAAESWQPRRPTRLARPIDAFDRMPVAELGGQLFTYADLRQRVDALADWLDEARQILIEPGVAWYRQADDTGTLVTYEDSDEPYAMSVEVFARSADDSRWFAGGDDAGWERALARLRGGEFHQLSLGFRPNNGVGMPSQIRGGAWLSVELRGQSTHGSCPLPDHQPATISFGVARRFLIGVDPVRDLFRRAAIAFEASLGYINGSGIAGTESPYERRGFGRWHGQRLDAVGRGLHWGNLIGPGHLGALGGTDRFTELEIPLVAWSTRQFWFEIADDPFGPVDDRADDLTPDLAALVPPDQEGRPLNLAGIFRA